MGRVIGGIGLAFGLGLAELTLRWTDEGVCPYVGEERHAAGEECSDQSGATLRWTDEGVCPYVGLAEARRG